MKIQDLIFIIIFLLVAVKKDSKISTIVGILCLLAAIPLFALWIFFSAQHLVYYSAAFFLLSVLLLLKRK